MYAASVEEENTRLRQTVERLELTEAQRVIEKGGNNPRERNPDMARPARPGEEEDAPGASEDLLKKLHAKNVAKERARARVEELATQLAAQLETVSQEKRGVVGRCAELEGQVEALQRALSDVDAACRKGVAQAQQNHGAQEHWRTASDLSIVMQEVIATIAASRRTLHAVPFAEHNDFTLSAGAAAPVRRDNWHSDTGETGLLRSYSTVHRSAAQPCTNMGTTEPAEQQTNSAVPFSFVDTNNDGVIDRAEFFQWAQQQPPASTSMAPLSSFGVQSDITAQQGNTVNLPAANAYQQREYMGLNSVAPSLTGIAQSPETVAKEAEDTRLDR